MLRFSKTCLLLVTFLSSVTFPAWPETYSDERPKVVVSVYNDADVAESVLGLAEKRAARIFAQAGVDVVWKDCSPGSESGYAELLHSTVSTRSGAEDVDCSRFEWPTHLAVRILPWSARSANEVFGVAFLSVEGTGCYSDIFYDRTLRLHTDWKVSLPDILASVVAHELGHLLLGSNSHSATGIMKARWQGEELRQLSRGNLRFTSEQEVRISGKLNRARRTVSLTALK